MPEIDPKNLIPNQYNPNELPSKMFQRLVSELRKQGVNRKPVRVRLVGESLVIVDGEHTARAAIEAGLTSVVYEVEECDDFEARRRTWAANKHGEENPVKLGYMIRGMFELRSDLSQRALAEILEMPESTLRNRLAYAVLADKSAIDKTLPPVADIARMSVREVRAALAGLDDEAGDSDEVEKKVTARPMDRVKKAFEKLTVDERAAFLEWAQQG